MKIFWLVAGALITILFLLPVFLITYQNAAIDLIHQYPLLAPIFIIAFRFLGVVVAPLPGTPVAFASLVLLPWWQGMIYNFIGVEIGALTAFYIARKFREPAVRYFAPLQKIHEWQSRVSRERQFWGFVALRIAAMPAFDFISYAAGLSRMPWRQFIAATILIDIPSYLVFFYFGGIAFKFSMYVFAFFAVLFLATVVVLGYSQKTNE